MILLEGRQIYKSFPVLGGMLRHEIGSVQALSDVSFRLEEGETLALVGGSGCGKSTLARIIAGLTPADSGTLLWKDRPLSEFTREERSRCVQMIFQDPYASLNPKLSIETQLAEAVKLSDRRTGVSASGRKNEEFHRHSDTRMRRCVELLEAVGLSRDVLSNYPFQFSGGQRQRIAIARALAVRPQLLIADEPLSALDVTIQAQILDLFRKLKAELGLTMLFITHDLAVASEASDRIIVLENGRRVEEGSTQSTLHHPTHPYTRALLAAVPQIPC